MQTILRRTLAAAALGATALAAQAGGLTATVYGGYAIDAAGDISFAGQTQLGQFLDPQINHWNDSIYDRWLPIPGQQDDRFGVEWTGYLIVPTAGTYGLRVTSDDGVQISLGGSLVIDEPQDQWYEVHTASFGAQAGLLPINIRFYEAFFYQGIRLEWQAPGATTWEVVPETALTPVPEPQAYALTLAGLGAIGLAVSRRRQR